jgi:hypothetical protein
MFDELSRQASLDLDGIIGNTHLAELTTPDVIGESLPLLIELSDASGLPLIAVIAPQDMPVEELAAVATAQTNQPPAPFLSIPRLVKTAWQ